MLVGCLTCDANLQTQLLSPRSWVLGLQLISPLALALGLAYALPGLLFPASTAATCERPD